MPEGQTVDLLMYLQDMGGMQVSFKAAAGRSHARGSCHLRFTDHDDADDDHGGGWQGDGFDMDGGMAWDLPSHETVTFKPFINRMVQAVLGPPERRWVPGL